MSQRHSRTCIPTAPGHIEVERAIAEIRAGRPVILDDGAATRIVVVAIDALDAELAEALNRQGRGSAQLILTAARLRRMGLDRANPGFLALPSVDIESVRTLAFDPEARIDAPLVELPPLFSAALELLRLAHVLPAALAISGAEPPPGLLSVALSHVRGYRAGRAKRLRIVSSAPTPLEGATDSRFVVFRGGEGLRDQVAIIIGKPDLAEPVTVRLHSACLTGDLFGSLKCDCGDQLRRSVRVMAENGGGVLLYLDQEGRTNGLGSKIHAYDLQAKGFDTFEADEILGFDADGRSFDFAGEMLKLLGVRRVRLMTNNPAKIAALRDAGLEVVSDCRIFGRRNAYNDRYLASKRDRAGHLLMQDC
jgi:GTP cyclohydrolase II